MCGWAVQTKLVTEELRRRGHLCEVMNINESRKKKSPDYVDVQNGLDYLLKVLRYTLRGYRIHMHVNAESPKGYLLALVALLVGRLAGRPAVLTFHGGLPQKYFPRPDARGLRWAYQLLFRLAGRLTCDSEEIRTAILNYGIAPERVAAIPCFSAELLEYRRVPLAAEIEEFLANHHPVFFCYVSFRPEYRLPVLREAMSRYRRSYPQAGFVLLGFPAKELPEAQEYVRTWRGEESQPVLLLGNLTHDEFLTLLTRSYASIRTPACDGISASVLESLAHGIPVVASENGRRPPGVVTYRENDSVDLCEKLVQVTVNYDQVRGRTHFHGAENHTGRTADLLLGEPTSVNVREAARPAGNTRPLEADSPRIGSKR
jgi:glycosyltransferase involved in cell wall biosynthesis